MTTITGVAKALASLNVEEFIDGMSTSGVINISNKITITGEYTEKVVVKLSNDGVTIYVGGKVVYET